MVTRHRVWMVVALLGAVTGCGDDPLTELIVAVDTDMAVPAMLDGIRIDVEGPGGEIRRAAGTLSGPADLPASLGVVHRGGSLGPVAVSVTGVAGGRDIVQRRARVDFVSGRAMVLRLTLEEACREVSCSPMQTCAGGRCQDELVPPELLEPYLGRIDRADGGQAIDGGVPRLDGCVPAAEACNGADDDCDGRVDEDIDLMTDVEHCGACDRLCPLDPAHGAGACVRGECEALCDSLYADCDESADNGCETFLASSADCGRCDNACEAPMPLCSAEGGSFSCVDACPAELTECTGACVDPASSPMHCGACDRACESPPHAVAVCVSGSCGYVCDRDFADCDGEADNGCETSLRTGASCGGCGVACSLPMAFASCTTRRCALVGCAGGFGDCDGRPDNGCEAELESEVEHCGGCGVACPADPVDGTPVCDRGVCAVVCDVGFANCDRDGANGCEVSLGDPASCGGCGIRCGGPTPNCAETSPGTSACVAGCAPPLVLCAGRCVEPSTDVLHCGGCSRPCPTRAHATRRCADGICFADCDAGYVDCDGAAGTGCEASLSSVEHCGACGRRCAFPRAIPACVAGDCDIAGCDPGYLDCDGEPENGCEADASTSRVHCGGCDSPCAGTCNGGSCDA